MGILTKNNLNNCNMQEKFLPADDWASRPDPANFSAEETIENLYAPGGTELDPDNLAEKFPDLKIFQPAPCDKCGSPFFWITVYDKTGQQPRCQGCEPIPSRGLVQRRLFILDFPPRWVDQDAERRRFEWEQSRKNFC